MALTLAEEKSPAVNINLDTLFDFYTLIKI